MTEKRFENRLNKDNIKFNTQNPVWDNKKEDALNVFEMIDLLNEQEEIIDNLQEQVHLLLHENHEYRKENQQLKQELDNIYLLIGRGDWNGLVDLLIDDEKCKTK